MTTALAPLHDEITADDMADVERLALALEKQELLGSLYTFLQAVWPILEPSKAFVPTWHLECLAQKLQDITLGLVDEKRWVFNFPPGTLKSILISVVWPAWVWARAPHKRFLTASYGQHLTVRDNLRVRDIIESPWYQARFPLGLVDDQNTKTRYNTTKGGWRIATSVGGVGTGEHPDIVIIDDPTTAAQAQSPAEREAANEWFDLTISSRGITRNVVIIIVMQRLHVDDLTGHVEKRKGWGAVRFPMRYEKAREATDADEGYTPDPLDPRTEPGELLCPTLIPEPIVKQLELDLGPHDTAAQLQQQPSLKGGGLFKEGWFKYVDAAPALMRVARGWDTAASEGKGDYTATAKIGEAFEWVIADGKKRLVSTGCFYVLHAHHDQLGPSGVDSLIRSTSELDGKTVAQREEKEGGSAGVTVIQARAKTLKGFNYAGVQVSGSKVTRVKPFRAQCEAGNVYLVRAPWNTEYVRELCAFPAGKNDDYVDCSSAAFNSVLLEEPPRQVRATW